MSKTPSPYAITAEMVDDILGTAMDSGSGYWTHQVSVVGQWPQGADYASDVLTKGGSLRWIEDEGRVEHTLTLTKMRKGIKQAAVHFGLTPARFYDEHDASYADVAVQFALLGEIVYG
jgi:hypothetical protein